MGIKLVTSESAIHDAILKEIERVNILTIRALSRLGEECVIEARVRSAEESWIDRSGNLRSSIGYVIASEGRIIKYSDFTVVKNGTEGPEAGKTLAEEIARKYRSGYALVVVAGMNYAEYVEAMDNKVVLASAELFARQRLPSMMQKLKSQIAS